MPAERIRSSMKRSFRRRKAEKAPWMKFTGFGHAKAGRNRQQSRKQGSFTAGEGSGGALVRLYAFIFRYSFPAMNTVTAVHTAVQTSTAHSGISPLWYNAANRSISICRRTAIGR